MKIFKETLLKKWLVLVLGGCLTLGWAGCNNADTTVEDAAEDTREVMEDAAEETGDAVEEAGDAVEEAADEADTEY